MTKKRADERLVDEGLVDDLKLARALIMAGRVVAGERRVDKSGERIDLDLPLRVKGPIHPYVSRGGVKLAAGLDHFAIGPGGWICLDIGASTGGFTDVLLQRGARRVYAVDVAYGALAWKLQRDTRVVDLSRTHACHLTPSLVPEPIDLVVADVSFTSLSRVLPPAVARLRTTGTALLLVKPQFEARSDEVEKGGIVRDARVRERVCDSVCNDVMGMGLEPVGLIPSPIQGRTGNTEFLLCARKPAT